MFHAALFTRMSTRPKWPITFSRQRSIDLESALVELHGVAPPAGTSHRLHHRIGTASLADIGNGDIRAGGSKSLRNCSANVAGASGHERNFSIEIHGALHVQTSVNRQRRKHIPFVMGG